MEKKKYWHCPTDWMGQRTGEWRKILLTEGEARFYSRFLHYELYEDEVQAMRAALS